MPKRLHPVVLVVENSREEAEAIQTAFEQLGYTEPIQFVDSGARAIEYLDGIGAYGHRDRYPMPDFVLLDLHVGDRDPFQILEWLRRRPHLSRVRVIVMTGGENVASMNRAYALGAASFITKPMNFSEFRDTVQSLYTQWAAAHKPAEQAHT